MPLARRRTPLLAPYLFILPNLAIFGLFTIWPSLNMVNISRYDSTDARTFRSVGLANFTEILSDREFGQVFGQTVVFTAVFVGLTTVFATVGAVVLNDAFPGRGFFRGVVLLPSLLSAVVVGLLWSWLLDRTNGLVNVWLGVLGLPEDHWPGWLTDGGLALGVVIAVGLWLHTGFYTLIMLAGLQGIDPALYEAARVDGASTLQRFRFLTWPLLRPTTLVVVILSTISGFQSFDFIWTLTGGGPLQATTLMVQYVYQRAFDSPIRYGLASAGAVILFGCVFTLTALNYLYGKHREAA